MALEVDTNKMRTIPFILQSFGLFLTFIGAIVGGATLKSEYDVDLSDADRWDSGVAIFCCVANLLVTLFDCRQFIPSALGMFLANVGSVFANTHQLRLLKAKGPTAGYALTCTGLLISFLSLFPLHRAGEIGKAFQGVRNLIGSAVTGFNVLACILLWAHSDEAKSINTLSLGMIAFVDVFLFGASYFGENKMAYNTSLLWFSYVQVFLMRDALTNKGESKKDLYIAAFVMAWLGHLAMLAVNLLFPPPAVLEQQEADRREAFPSGPKETFAAREDPVTDPDAPTQVAPPIVGQV